MGPRVQELVGGLDQRVFVGCLPRGRLPGRSHESGVHQRVPGPEVLPTVCFPPPHSDFRSRKTPPRRSDLRLKVGDQTGEGSTPLHQGPVPFLKKDSGSSEDFCGSTIVSPESTPLFPPDFSPSGRSESLPWGTRRPGATESRSPRIVATTPLSRPHEKSGSPQRPDRSPHTLCRSEVEVIGLPVVTG